MSLALQNFRMSYLPLECVEQIVQYVETPNELCKIMHINKLLFFTAARCVWRNPMDTVSRTNSTFDSLLLLIRQIFALSPSQDEDVVKVRRFFEWAAGRTKPIRNVNVQYHDGDDDVIRRPFTRYPAPLLDYLSFINVFDVFACPVFHSIVCETICIPLYLRLNSSSEAAADEELELQFFETPEGEDFSSTVDLFERCLVTAAVGHRLKRLKRLSVPFRHLDRYLDLPSSSSSPSPSKLHSIQEMVWDLAPQRTGLWGPNYTQDEAMVARILSRVQQSLEQCPFLHTVEVKEEPTVIPYEDMMTFPEKLYKALPPLPGLKTLEFPILERVFARWKETDLSQVTTLRMTCGNYNSWEGKDSARFWTAVQGEEGEGDGEAGQVPPETEPAHGDGDGGEDPNAKRRSYQDVILQRLRSLRKLDFETEDETVFAWAVQERLCPQPMQPPLVPLQSLKVQCPLALVERITNDAAIAFGNTLETLVVAMDEHEKNPFLFHYANKPTPAFRTIRIGQGWHLPRLARLSLDVDSYAALEIDPAFLANTPHLVHLELVDSNSDEEPLEEDEPHMPKMHAPEMEYLRLIGTASWMFDPASLESMSQSLKYLELRNQCCVFESGPDHEQWRWSAWDMPRLEELHLEGSSVAGYPWHKMADSPQLATASFGAGAYNRKVAPWLDPVAILDKEEKDVKTVGEEESVSNSIRKKTKGSSLTTLTLTGAWLLTVPVLERLLQDLCPKLETLTLKQCKGHTGLDLAMAMAKHQELRMIETSRSVDITDEDLKLDPVEKKEGEEGQEDTGVQPFIRFSNMKYVLPVQLVAPRKNLVQ
ncbi:hypothetical protein BGZ73_002787 [Actinomortierella ambigua]|nr:hypothetical protein BGZ73_002787 [Actinomortierella ambigua]